jgi:two-component system response regulator HydG
MAVAAVATVPEITSRMNLLVAHDEECIRELCAEVALQSGMKVVTVATAQEAMDVLENSNIDILVTDLKLSDSNGPDLIDQVHSTYSEVAVIALSGYENIDSAISGNRLRTVDYLPKPFRIAELLSIIERAALRVDLQNENKILREQVRTQSGFGGLIGLSPSMQSVYKLTHKVSQHDCPVLILGETGTGKEMIARSIHFSGARQKAVFAPVDCSSLVSTLIETELFGHAKGAFTDAAQSKRGLLESANGGTVFLDEIGDMPVALQSKLLRALQEREVRPVGSTERRPINVRIIAATNRNLENEVRAGTFRQDLYFRLNVVQVKLPPLRERKSDIPLLVTSFLEKFSGTRGCPPTISEDAMAAMISYDWPGNVRELENCIERAIALGSGSMVEINDLPGTLIKFRSTAMPSTDEIVPLVELERRAILHTLSQIKDKVMTARMLGIGKTTLYRKLKKYKRLEISLIASQQQR